MGKSPKPIIFRIPPPKKLRRLIFITGILLPSLMLSLVAILLREDILLVLICVGLIAMLFLGYPLLIWFSSSQITVYPDKLKIRTPRLVSERTIAKIDIAKVSIIDWKSETLLKPSPISPTLFTTLWEVVSGVKIAEKLLRLIKLKQLLEVEDYYVGEYQVVERKALLVSTASRNLLIETKKGELILLSPPGFENFINSFRTYFGEIKGA